MLGAESKIEKYLFLNKVCSMSQILVMLKNVWVPVRTQCHTNTNERPKVNFI